MVARGFTVIEKEVHSTLNFNTHEKWKILLYYLSVMRSLQSETVLGLKHFNIMIPVTQQQPVALTMFLG